MPKLLKDGEVLENSWQTVVEVESLDQLPEGQVIVPLAFWQANAAELKARANVAVLLPSDASENQLAELEAGYQFLAIEFPKFADGRGFSLAYLLRERFAYTGEISAVGDVLLDQYFYLQRVGVNAFEVKDDQNPETAKALLGTFTETYQASNDEASPLFRRRG